MSSRTSPVMGDPGQQVADHVADLQAHGLLHGVVVARYGDGKLELATWHPGLQSMCCTACASWATACWIWVVAGGRILPLPLPLSSSLLSRLLSSLSPCWRALTRSSACCSRSSASRSAMPCRRAAL